MVRIDLHETIPLPEGVTAAVNPPAVTVKGPEGELTREFQAKGVTIKADQENITLEATQVTKPIKNLLLTFKAHLKNMVHGAQEGFTYKLKVCSGHFPMTVAAKDGKLEIKNYLGEKVPRVLNLKEGADVKVDGEEITVKAANREVAGQVAADIENITRRPGFDRRVFQDGIYITQKPVREM